MSYVELPTRTSANLNSASDINQLQENIADTRMGTVPVGAYILWDKSLPGTPQVLPGGFCEANGQVINDAESPYNGTAIRNMNSSNAIFEGGAVSGVTSDRIASGTGVSTTSMVYIFRYK